MKGDNCSQGMESYCIRAFAEAMEVIPYTLAENAGLNPIDIVTDLRARHVAGDSTAGINVRKGAVRTTQFFCSKFMYKLFSSTALY